MYSFRKLCKGIWWKFRLLYDIFNIKKTFITNDFLYFVNSSVWLFMLISSISYFILWPLMLSIPFNCVKKHVSQLMRHPCRAHVCLAKLYHGPDLEFEIWVRNRTGFESITRPWVMKPITSAFVVVLSTFFVLATNYNVLPSSTSANSPIRFMGRYLTSPLLVNRRFGLFGVGRGSLMVGRVLRAVCEGCGSRAAALWVDCCF